MCVRAAGCSARTWCVRGGRDFSCLRRAKEKEESEASAWAGQNGEPRRLTPCFVFAAGSGHTDEKKRERAALPLFFLFRYALQHLPIYLRPVVWGVAGRGACRSVGSHAFPRRCRRPPPHAGGGCPRPPLRRVPRPAPAAPADRSRPTRIARHVYVAACPSLPCAEQAGSLRGRVGLDRVAQGEQGIAPAMRARAARTFFSFLGLAPPHTLTCPPPTRHTHAGRTGRA